MKLLYTVRVMEGVCYPRCFNLTALIRAICEIVVINMITNVHNGGDGSLPLYRREAIGHH